MNRKARCGAYIEGVAAIAGVAGECKNTTAHSFEFVDRSEAFNVGKMDGVKSLRCFEWSGTSCKEGTPVTITGWQTAADYNSSKSDTIEVDEFYSIDFTEDGSSLDSAAVKVTKSGKTK